MRLAAKLRRLRRTRIPEPPPAAPDGLASVRFQAALPASSLLGRLADDGRPRRTLRKF